MIITEEELMAHIGIDYEDEVTHQNLESAILTADAYLQGSIGKNYPKDDPRAKMLAKMVAADLYENRGMEPFANASNQKRLLVQSLELQLKLELERGEDGESV